MLRILFEWLEFALECFESSTNLHVNALNPVRMLKFGYELFEFQFELFESSLNGWNLSLNASNPLRNASICI